MGKFEDTRAKHREDLFSQMVDGVLAIDPVAFCQKYLTLDGAPFRLSGNGYKPFADIYRYIGVKALEPDAKPVVFIKGRQVGGTTMAAALELFFMASGLFGVNGKSPMRIMHCFPLLELGYAYTKTKLNSLIKTSKMVATDLTDKRALARGQGAKAYIESKIDRAAASSDSMTYKQFENGNYLFIESTGLTADRIRSFTADCMFMDEAQNIPGAALANATKILSQAKYGKVGDGVQVYFGTPKQKGSEFHKMWMMSSRQYYHLGCENCKEYFPLYTPESSEWENIWIEDNIPPDYVDPKTGLKPHGFIVKCIHCGHEQDKRPAAERGKWFASNKDENYKYVGYHLNQLFMPHFDRAKVISEKPENHPFNTERAYQNEVLGEFYTGDAAPITAEQIHDLCADMERKFRRHIALEEGKRVYLGLDWGQKADIDQMLVGGQERQPQGQSYSAAVILTVDGPFLLSIQFAKLLKKNDPDYKRGVVDELMRRYSVSLAVGDIGHANDLTYTLQKDYGDRFLASRAGGNIKNHVKFLDDVFPKEIRFDKNFYIEEMFAWLKKGQIRFPFGSYEQIGWLVQHCSSMEMKATMDRSGDINIKYVKGLTQNDGFMALINAYLAYRYDATNGFKIIHPDRMNNEPEQQSSIPAVLGHCAYMNPMNRSR